MPIYEYQCQSCGKRSELLQRMADPPLAVCPECGGEVKKLMSAPAVQFKGSGWYVTDYAGKKGGEGKSESKASDSTSKEGGSSDKAASAPAPAAGSSGSSGSSGSD
ncbi:MAG TPA: FmdB family zinc ribbon protein [Thermoanaerobaculia bacterium]|nr:FmdB family zinc ribbon protein [Thermoanaerobaculia bacterium]